MDGTMFIGVPDSLLRSFETEWRIAGINTSSTFSASFSSTASASFSSTASASVTDAAATAVSFSCFILDNFNIVAIISFAIADLLCFIAHLNAVIPSLSCVFIILILSDKFPSSLPIYFNNSNIMLCPVIVSDFNTAQCKGVRPSVSGSKRGNLSDVFVNKAFTSSNF